MNLPPATPGTVTEQQLVNHIEQDIAACEALLQLLGAEREAVKERQLTLLDDIITQKASRLRVLEESARSRSHWVAAATTATTTQEQRWLELLAGFSPELLARWQVLKDLFVECRVQNDVNGKALARAQNTYGQMLGLMRGQPANSKLYSPKGAPRSSLLGHNLGEA